MVKSCEFSEYRYRFMVYIIEDNLNYEDINNLYLVVVDLYFLVWFYILLWIVVEVIIKKLF